MKREKIPLTEETVNTSRWVKKVGYGVCRVGRYSHIHVHTTVFKTPNEEPCDYFPWSERIKESINCSIIEVWFLCLANSAIILSAYYWTCFVISQFVIKSNPQDKSLREIYSYICLGISVVWRWHSHHTQNQDYSFQDVLYVQKALEK